MYFPNIYGLFNVFSFNCELQNKEINDITKKHFFIHKNESDVLIYRSIDTKDDCLSLQKDLITLGKLGT